MDCYLCALFDCQTAHNPALGICQQRDWSLTSDQEATPSVSSLKRIRSHRCDLEPKGEQLSAETASTTKRVVKEVVVVD